MNRALYDGYLPRKGEYETNLQWTKCQNIPHMIPKKTWSEHGLEHVPQLIFQEFYIY